MAADKSIINLVKQFARDVSAEGVNLKKVILFGSYAQNKHRRDSDIDVALIADDFKGFVYLDLDLFIKAKIKKSYSKIQVQTFSNSQFTGGNPFIGEIIRTGIEIKLE